jgi:3'(2'), 5'-bisphosphate nucleotidase
MLEALEDAALAAGKAILTIRNAGAHTSYKADRTPVTEADEEAERIILARLSELYPEIPVVAEESVARGEFPSTGSGRFFLVDPLDGTKEFIKGRDDFTVNIALIESGTPTAGVVYAPALGLAYSGADGEAFKILVTADFQIASREPIRACAMRQPPVAVASRSHRTPETDAYLAEAKAEEVRSIGSSLKFCLLAEGDADLYPRFGRTMQWDTAAGDAVLRAAGGRTVTTQGEALRYGCADRATAEDFANPDFIAYGATEKPTLK